LTNCASNQTGPGPYVTNLFVPWSVSCLLHFAVFAIFALTQPEFQRSEKRQTRDGMTLKLLLVFDELVSDEGVQKKPNIEQLRNHVQEIVKIDNDKKEGLYVKVFDKLSPLTLEGSKVKKSEESGLQKNAISAERNESLVNASIKIKNKKSGDIDTKIASQSLNINDSIIEDGEPVLLKESKLEASTMPQEVFTKLDDGDDGYKETLHEHSSKSSLVAKLSDPTPKNIASTHYSKTQFDKLKQPTSFENKDLLAPEEVVSSIPAYKLNLRKEDAFEVLNSTAEVPVVKKIGVNQATSGTRQVKFDTKKLLDHLVPNALPKKEKVNLSVPFVEKKMNQASLRQSTKKCESLSDGTSIYDIKNFYAQMNAENVRVSQLLGTKFRPFLGSQVDITSLLNGSSGALGYGQGVGAQITISYLLTQQHMNQAFSSICIN
jgi:hypothetical protein